MGLFSKKKTISFKLYKPIVDDPLKKTKYYKSNVLKNDIQKAFTRKMIQNHYDGMSNKENMKDLIQSANTLFENPIMFHRTTFGRKIETMNYSFDKSALERYLRYLFPDFHSLIDYTYGDSDNRIADKYLIRMQLNSFNSKTRVGIYDNYYVDTTDDIAFEIIGEFNPDPSKYTLTREESDKIRKRIKDLKKKLLTSNSKVTITAEINKLQKLLNEKAVPHKNHFEIGQRIPPSFLGIVVNLEAYFDEKVFAPMIKEFHKLWNISFDDPDEELRYYIKSVSTSYNHPNSSVTIVAHFYWNSLPNGYELTYTTEIPNVLLNLDKLFERKELIWVEYLSNRGSYEIKYFEENDNILKKTPMVMRISSLLPLKGEGADKKDKYWRAVMLKSSYLDNKKKKPSFQRQDTPDLYTQLQDEDKIKSAKLLMTLNLTPTFLKKHRDQKEWQMYFKAVVKYFELITDYTDDLRTTGKLNIKIPNSIASYRIRVAKKSIKSNVIYKKMFISTEPYWYKPCLYLNLPDYSKSTSEERSKGIFHYYDQYIFDLYYFWTSDVIGFYTTDGYSTPPLNTWKFLSRIDKVRVEIATDEEVKEFERVNKQKWYNDGITNPIIHYKQIFPFHKDITPVDVRFRYDPNVSLEEQLKQYTKELPRDDVEYGDSSDFEKKWKQDFYIKRMKKLRGIKLYSIDEMDEIPPMLETSVLAKEFPSYDTSHVERYIPPLPTSIWFRTPYIAKTEIFLSQLYIDFFIQYDKKVRTLLGKIFGIVLIVVAVIISYVTSNPIALMYAKSLVISGFGYQVSQLGGVFKYIGFFLQLYGFYTSFGGSMEVFFTQLAENTVITASSLINMVSSTFDIIVSTLTTEENAKLRAFMNATEEEKKKIDEEIEKISGAVPLSLFDVKSDMMSNIDSFYETMYGTPLYEGYDLLYQTNQSMTDFDRLK